jgi:hypothetical protein
MSSKLPSCTCARSPNSMRWLSFNTFCSPIISPCGLVAWFSYFNSCPLFGSEFNLFLITSYASHNSLIAGLRLGMQQHMTPSGSSRACISSGNVICFVKFCIGMSGKSIKQSSFKTDMIVALRKTASVECSMGWLYSDLHHT